jgi:hypothetical protein
MRLASEGPSSQAKAAARNLPTTGSALRGGGRAWRHLR